jgi:predicted dehydrogenase
MASHASYVILGRGRWAKRMHSILSGEGRKVSSIEEARALENETESHHLFRLANAFRASHAEIAWLCVSPGPHVPALIETALDAGLHVIVEKPWYGSAEITQRLVQRAREKKLLIAVHYEYCLLDEVEDWKRRLSPGCGLQFSARFFLTRPDHSGIPALDNLGTHLFSIRAFAVPESTVIDISCAYELPDERIVRITGENQLDESIDLFSQKQPIIQRFFQKCEAALDGAAFSLDLNFALRVSQDLNRFREAQRR